MARPLVVLLAVSMLAPACAFAIEGPAPDRPRSKPPRCDTGKGLVVLDGLMATVSGLLALALVDEEPAVALVPASIGALYLGGAISGHRSATRCREAMDDFESYLAARSLLEQEERTRTARRPEPPPSTPASSLQPQPLPQPQTRSHSQAQPPQPPQALPHEPPAQPPPSRVPQPSAQGQHPLVPTPARAAPAVQEDEWRDFWREVP